MENVEIKKVRKVKTSIWDLYKNEITHLLSIDLNIKAIYKILISKMEIDTKPSSLVSAAFLELPPVPHDVASPAIRTPDKIMLNSFIIGNIKS